MPARPDAGLGLPVFRPRGAPPRADPAERRRRIRGRRRWSPSACSTCRSTARSPRSTPASERAFDRPTRSARHPPRSPSPAEGESGGRLRLRPASRLPMRRPTPRVNAGLNDNPAALRPSGPQSDPGPCPIGRAWPDEGRQMPKRTDISSILIIGAGPIIIGQACEFDYSGTQACKALREEGYRIVLVNSNPATIMTDPDMADATYVEPITPEIVAKIIEKERPDAILPTMGGQTALNCALSLQKHGRARQVRRPDDRRHRRGDRQGRGPAPLPRRHDQDRARHAEIGARQRLGAKKADRESLPGRDRPDRGGQRRSRGAPGGRSRPSRRAGRRARPSGASATASTPSGRR